MFLYKTGVGSHVEVYFKLLDMVEMIWKMLNFAKVGEDGLDVPRRFRIGIIRRRKQTCSISGFSEFTAIIFWRDKLSRT